MPTITISQGLGDCWTWVGIETTIKLIVSYMVGLRDVGYAREFMNDLADRISIAFDSLLMD